MSLAVTPVVLSVACLLAVLAYHLLLWVGVRLFHIEGATLGRMVYSDVAAVLTGLILGSGYALVVWPALQAIGLPASAAVGATVLSLAAMALANLVIAVSFAKLFLQAAWRKALAACALAYFAAILAGIAPSVVLTAGFAKNYVVPTGAMAPTIYGCHADFVCSNCQFKHAVNMSEWSVPGRSRPREDLVVKCPNCGQAGDVPVSSPIRSGDRVVVERTLLPRRWDIAVFLYPEDPSVSYVKRIVGLPGETIEIFGGDIFINGKRAVEDSTTGAKPWFPVHDTALVPAETVPTGPRWQPTKKTSAWKEVSGAWQFSSDGKGTRTIEFRGKLTEAMPYNGATPRNRDASFFMGESENTGDVRLQCVVESFSGTGELLLHWQFGHQSAVATFSRADEASITLAGDAIVADGIPDPSRNCHVRLPRGLASGDRVAIAFRDGHVSLLFNGIERIRMPVGPQDIETAKRAAVGPAETCQLKISASDCQLTLSRITVAKDIYYHNYQMQARSRDFVVGNLYGCDGRPATLGSDEYFALGDNSTRSKDSRFWGAVPGANMVGRVRVTYWPPDRWRTF